MTGADRLMNMMNFYKNVSLMGGFFLLCVTGAGRCNRRQGWHCLVRRLTQLNADFLASAENGDVRRFEQILAEDFMASLPDFLLRDKKQFLDMMAAPRPFAELKADEVRIRLLGDFAIIHAHMTFRTADGARRQGRYTDDWQRRDGKWLCVAANTFWEP